MLLALLIFVFILGILFAAPTSARQRSSEIAVKEFADLVQPVLKSWRAGSPLYGIFDTKTVVKKSHNGPDLLLTRAQVEEQFALGTWERETYEDLRTTLLACDRQAKTFPCVYATKGYRDNDHRYIFVDSEDPSEPHTVRRLGPAMRAYLKLAPELGPNTSLVIVCKPGTEIESVRTYSLRFWDLLKGLRIYDQDEWPEMVPSVTDDEHWTFCFAGEPVFPIARTPAHEKRWSRHASTLVIAMQPKWVIDNLLSTPDKRKDATERVRGLLRKFDSIDISPDLASFGDPGTSESRQLTLMDDNETFKVPYSHIN